MPFLVLILLFVLVIFGYIFYAYNRLTQLRNTAETEWSQVDVLLKKRADLIPNLVEVVKGYAKHEKDVLTNVARARAEAVTGDDRAGAENDLSKSVAKIFALREQYPDLKANENFLELQRELFDIEDQIARRRNAYNDVVKAYNDFVLKFPGNVVASVSGFALMKLFIFQSSRETSEIDL